MSLRYKRFITSFYGSGFRVTGFFLAVMLLQFVVMVSESKALVWKFYDSESDMYVLEFPDDPNAERSTLRVDDDTVLEYEKLNYVETIDSGECKGVKKYLTLIMDQTWEKGVDRDVDDDDRITHDYLVSVKQRYVDYYGNLGGKLVDERTLWSWDGFKGIEFTIENPLEDNSSLSVKTRVFANGKTRIQQIVIVPSRCLLTASTTKYFASLKLYPGEERNSGNAYKEWRTYNLNEDGTFSVIMPDVVFPWHKEKPVIIQRPLSKIDDGKNLRILETTFFDSFYQDELEVKVFLYNFKQEDLSKVIFDRFIMENFIKSKSRIDKSYLRNPRKDIRGVEYELQSYAGDGFSEYVKAYFVNNYFGDNYIIVMQAKGRKKTIKESGFFKLISNSFNFENSQ